MKYFIYKITNLINGKCYIGKSYRPEVRFEEHKADARNGSTNVFHSAIRKYGEESFSFEVIAEGTADEANELEKHYIKEFKSYIHEGSDLGYNMTEGGDGFTSEQTKIYLVKRTAEGRNIFSKDNPEWTNYSRQRVEDGTHHFLSEEHKKRTSEAQRNLVGLGKHHLQGKEAGKRSSEVQKRRIAEGTFHMFTNEAKTFMREKALREMEAGTNLMVTEAICPKCGKTGTPVIMKRWHFENCGKKFVTWNDGVKNYSVELGKEVDPSWKRGMVKK